MTRPILEREVEAALVKRVKLLGGEIRKVQWIGRRGAPDRYVLFPAGSHRSNVWVELKAPGKKPDPHQEREHAVLRRAGEQVLVIDFFAKIEEHFPL